MPSPEVPKSSSLEEEEKGTRDPEAPAGTDKLIQTVGAPGRPSRTVVIESIPWWKSPNVLMAIGGIGAGTVAAAKAFHIPFPFTEAELTMGTAAVVSIASSAWFLWKRFKYGNDPNSPARRLTG